MKHLIKFAVIIT